MSCPSKSTRSDRVGRTLPIMCPLFVLAVDTAHAAALACATFVVVVASNLAISTLRAFVPAHMRLPAFALVIGLFATTVVLTMQAFIFDLTERITLFAALIAAICMNLAYAAPTAPREPVRTFVDGVVSSLGFATALIALGVVRETTGAALPLTAAAPGAFLIVGFALAAKNALVKKT